MRERDAERRVVASRRRSTRSVTASGISSPPTEKRADRDLRARRRAPRRAPPRCARARAPPRSRRAGRRRRATSARPLPPWRSGALTTHGGAELAGARRGDDLPARLRHARRGEQLALPDLLVASAAVAGETGCGRPSLAATRAATADRRSRSRARSRRRARAPRRAARSSARPRSRRCSGGRRAEPGRRGIAVADRRPDAVRPRRLEQARAAPGRRRGRAGAGVRSRLSPATARIVAVAGATARACSGGELERDAPQPPALAAAAGGLIANAASEPTSDDRGADRRRPAPSRR